MKQRLSLKGQGLQLLSQREHSRAELRRKLLTHARSTQIGHARKRVTQSTIDGGMGAVETPLDPTASNPTDGMECTSSLSRQAQAQAQAQAEAEAPKGADLTEEVEAVLDWLQAHRYLCDERFVESRVHARLSRFGNLRIRQELAQHGLELSAEDANALKHSELERAKSVWARKFGERLPSDAAERGKQTRFLAGRGFSSEVIRHVLRGEDAE